MRSPNTLNNSVELFDRLIDWETSLTPRETFLNTVTNEDGLRIKYGTDITAPTLHIGHAVNLRVMREMQNIGHKVVFLLGGFTTLIGDPTDKLKARSAPDLVDMQVNQDAFIDQVKTILNFEDKDAFEIRNNIEWWGGIDEKGTISLLEFFQTLGDITLSLLASRDMFRRRQENNEPIRMSEMLYPVVQGYDSVMMESDITVVGSDQLFNENMGRMLQKKAGQREQMIVCTKVTPGLDGGPKQSKSTGNYVGIADDASTMYNKVMLLNDELTKEWLEVYTNIPLVEVNFMIKEQSHDPISLKQNLAYSVTEMFHGSDNAAIAQEEFQRKLRGEKPIDPVNLNYKQEDSLKTTLQRAGYKSGNLNQFILDRSISIISDGVEKVLSIDDLNNKTALGDIIRIGKNKYFRLTPE